MARRSRSLLPLVGVLLVAMLPAAAGAAEPPPLPSSIAAVGDSITRAASSGGTLGADYPANSWSTGTSATVNSHYARLLALTPAISGRAFNDAVSGAKVADLAGQMQVAAARQPGYLTVLIGGNDLCTDTVAQMTSVADFEARFTAAMETLASGSPGTRVFVTSIPRVNQLWELFKGSFSARFVWSVADICQSLLANPTSTQAADVQRRAEVAQRNVDYNAALARVCARYAQCRFDGNAVYDVAFAKSDVAGDYFHPSVAGQAKLAAVTWGAGYWPNGGPAPDAAPTASFTASCTALDCLFDASGSTDDHGIASYGWAFGDGSTGTGQLASHAFASPGTYTVTLTVTDTAGQAASSTSAVTVSAEARTVHLVDATGSSSSRKGGWIATVTVGVRDDGGLAVGGATVTGTWSTGGTGSCVTAATGTCSFSTNLGRKVAGTTWTVSGIAASGFTYDAGANAVQSVTLVAP